MNTEPSKQLYSGNPVISGPFGIVANDIRHPLQAMFLFPEDRIRWAHREFGEGLVMTSSFGVQSVIMLELLKKTGLKIPVVCVDIPGAKYDAQRAYRLKMQEHYGFDMRLFPAADDADKVAAMNRGLAAMGATAQIDGIRRSQTKNRADKPLYDPKPNGFVHIHAIADWNDDRAEAFIGRLDSGILHPDYAPGARSTGGRVLAANENKDECGIHVPGI